MARRNMAKTPRAPRRSVTFILEDAPGKDVRVAGSFNGWKPEKQLVDKENSGVYSCRMLLEPGTYEYKLRIRSARSTACWWSMRSERFLHHFLLR